MRHSAALKPTELPVTPENVTLGGVTTAQHQISTDETSLLLPTTPQSGVTDGIIMLTVSITGEASAVDSTHLPDIVPDTNINPEVPVTPPPGMM